MASDDVIPSFASISGVDPFSLALGIRYLGEVNSVRSDRCHGGQRSVHALFGIGWRQHWGIQGSCDKDVCAIFYPLLEVTS